MDTGRIETVKREVVYRNRWMSVREDVIRHPDGSPGIYGVVDKPTAALIIAIQQGGLHLVEQYRYPLGRRSWEFPQGTWADDRQTPVEELARAELAQETGLRARRMERIGRMALAPGLTSQWCEIFVATELTAGEPDPDPEEQGMRQAWFARTDFEQMLRSGEIIDGPTMAAHTALLLHEPKYLL